MIHLRQGNVNESARLAWQYDLPLMRARVLIAQVDPSAALALLEPLRQQAEAKGATRRLLDVMAVQSVALYACGEKKKRWNCSVRHWREPNRKASSASLWMKASQWLNYCPKRQLWESCRTM
jgi:hypothetical protein